MCIFFNISKRRLKFFIKIWNVIYFDLKMFVTKNCHYWHFTWNHTYHVKIAVQNLLSFRIFQEDSWNFPWKISNFDINFDLKIFVTKKLSLLTFYVKPYLSWGTTCVPTVLANLPLAPENNVSYMGSGLASREPFSSDLHPLSFNANPFS